MTRQHVTERILEDLSPAERTELQAALHALHTVSAEDHGPGEAMFDPEGLRKMMNMLPPAVHSKLWQVHELTNEKRAAPFQPKMTPEIWADTLGLDSGTMERFKTTLDSAEVAQSLVKRLGGPDDNQPTAHDTRRQAVEDAWLRDQPMAQARAEADHAVATAAPEMPLREALTTLVDHHASKQ